MASLKPHRSRTGLAVVLCALVSLGLPWPRAGADLGRRLKDLAGMHPKIIAEVRGIGLMWGIKCVVANAELCKRLFENGLLTVPAADNVVRLLPPLIIDSSHLDEAMAILEKSCGELS